MKYIDTVIGRFKERPNRFIAKVEINGVLETVHVKNTGRCKELLLPDVEVVLEKAKNPERKTKYDLIAVNKKGLGWINMDSQAPNKVVAQWLEEIEADYVKGEYTYHNSRLDFYFEKNGQKYLMEVKGCTLEIEGQGYFPDAPTARGAKHLEELIRAQKEGYQGIIAFVIQMPGITKVWPNQKTDPVFTEKYNEALAAGVKVLFLTCDVTPNTLEINCGNIL